MLKRKPIPLVGALDEDIERYFMHRKQITDPDYIEMPGGKRLRWRFNKPMDVLTDVLERKKDIAITEREERCLRVRF
jgi:hypothetical protein